MKQYFLQGIAIIMGIFILALIYQLILLPFEKEPDWETKGVENIGVVSRLRGTSASTVWMIHYVEDKKYESPVGFNVYGLVIGDKFIVKYLHENPSEFIVLSWKPVFAEPEKDEIIETSGEIARTYRFKYWGDEPHSGITFNYYVEGVKFKREQHLPPNYKSIYPNLSKGQKFKVLYWKKNPQRAIIYLNEPIE